MVGSRIWFISDPHFHHANMIAGGKIGIRSQFSTVAEMNDAIVDGINTKVQDHDKLYILGDITLNTRDSLEGLECVRLLKGHKRLLLGNHDRKPVQRYLEAGFEKVLAYREMAGILFSHIPAHPSQFYRFKGNVHGHTHASFVRQGPDIQPDPRYINVCVEAVSYTPVLFDQLVAHFTISGGRA